ncbi:MAG: Methyl-accepting chemotaxis protein McpB [Spirochaetes bacterium ADurb.Bin133]|nr:MAG: Methyl-accepting chemotaxis protein McpB [Spirochaetes bacterium ADurb.Bin133]
MRPSFKIKTQFTVQAIFSILLLLALLFTLFEARTRKERLINAEEQKYFSMLLADEFRQTSQDLTRTCRVYVATGGDMRYWDEYWNIVAWRKGDIPRPQTVNANLYPGRTVDQQVLMKELGYTERELSLLKQAIDFSNKLIAVEDQAMRCVKEGRFVSGPCAMRGDETLLEFAIRIVNDEAYHAEVEKIMGPVGVFERELDERVTLTTQNESRRMDISQSAATGFAIVVIISVAFFVFFLSRSVINPILKTSEVFTVLASGDLTYSLRVGQNNEIGGMARNFNEMLESVKRLIRAIQKNAEFSSEIGQNLSSNMTETASAINQITVNIQDVKQRALKQATSVSETAATMEVIINAIKQLNDSIESQSASVVQSSASIEEMAANIASITQTLGKSDVVVRDLATATFDGKETLYSSNNITQKIMEQSSGLLEASDVIQNIASQTNLLAMNAAIEAAHAGEYGKGFAVVADEIRKLAEESSAQGKKITSTLKNFSIEIETLSGSSKVLEEKFNAIYSLAEQVKDVSASVMRAMTEQERGSREVLSSIKNINEITAEVKYGSEDMLRGGEQAAAEMHKLDDLTRAITDSMNEMASGAAQVNQAAQEVNKITQKNEESIENLSREVGKFKV